MQVSMYSSDIVHIESGGEEAKFLRLVHKDESSLIFIDERLARELVQAVRWAFPELAAGSEDEALDKWASEHEAKFAGKE